MGLLLPQSDSAEAAWITVAEAAARSGYPERTIRYNCKRWSTLGKADRRSGEWLIDPRVDSRFLATRQADDRAEVLDIRSVPAPKRRTANIRRTILQDLDAYVGRAVTSGVGRVEAIKRFAADHGKGSYSVEFNWRTLYNWASRNATAPASGLIDRRGLVGETREPDVDVKHLFEQRWLTGNQISLRAAYDELLSYCDRKSRWCFGSYSTFRRWVHATYPKPMQVLNRRGEQAYRRDCEPTLHQDPDAFAAGELYVGDHHMFRHIVWYRGRLIRPWLTAWMDQRSLLYVGYVIVPSPNQHTILAAAKHACQRFGPAPKWLMDNGRDYSGYAVSGGLSRRAGLALRKGYLDADQISGLFAILQAQAIFCLPESPNGKIIEGMFRPLEERFGRGLPNYCGADPDDKPHDLVAANARETHMSLAQRMERNPESVPQFEDFAQVAAAWIDQVHNVKPQDGIYCQGRAPIQVFNDRQATRAELADPRVLDLLDMQWSREVPVRKGVRFNKLVYGEWDPRIIELQGTKVRVSYNPNDIGSIGVWSLDYKFICRADCGQLVNRNATDEDKREAFKLRAQLRKAMRVVRDKQYLNFANAAELTLVAQQDAAKRMLEAQPRTNEPEPGQARNIRIVRTPLDGQINAVRSAFDAPSVEAPELDILSASVPTSADLSGCGTGVSPVLDGDEPIEHYELPPASAGVFDDELCGTGFQPVMTASAERPDGEATDVVDEPHILDLLRRDWDD